MLAIPQPVSLPERSADARPPSGLPDGFRFLFAFDYLSVFDRKNPLATIDAFTRAFEPGSGASLIVKSLNSRPRSQRAWPTRSGCRGTPRCASHRPAASPVRA